MSIALELNKKDIPGFLSDHTRTRTFMLVLSCISLFVGLTGSLPSEISAISLKIPKDSTVPGWFLFGVTGYFFIKYFIVVGFATLLHLWPGIVRKQLSKITGGHAGLPLNLHYAMEYAEDEAREDAMIEEYEGPEAAELLSLEKRTKERSHYLEQKPKHYWHWVVYTVEGIAPTVFSAVCLYILCEYLLSVVST